MYATGDTHCSSLFGPNDFPPKQFILYSSVVRPELKTDDNNNDNNDYGFNLISQT